MSANYYEEIFDFPVNVYYRRLGFDFNRESFESLGTEFIRAYEKTKGRCRLQKYARHLLAALHRRNIQQAILSAYRHDTLVQLLHDKQVSRYFNWIIGADDHYAHGKAKQGAALLGKMSPPVGRTLMVGDTVHDFEVATQIGIDCILVHSGHQSKKRLEACRCPVFQDLVDAGKWILGRR